MENILKVFNPDTPKSIDISDPTGITQKLAELEKRVDGHDSDVLKIVHDLQEKQKNIESAFSLAKDAMAQAQTGYEEAQKAADSAKKSAEESKIAYDSSLKAINDSKVAYDNALIAARESVNTWNTFLDKQKRAWTSIYNRMNSFGGTISDFANYLSAISSGVASYVNDVNAHLNNFISWVTNDTAPKYERCYSSENFFSIKIPVINVTYDFLKAFTFAGNVLNALRSSRTAYNYAQNVNGATINTFGYLRDIFGGQSGKANSMKNAVQPMVNEFKTLMDEMNALAPKKIE